MGAEKPDDSDLAGERVDLDLAELGGEGIDHLVLGIGPAIANAHHRPSFLQSLDRWDRQALGAVLGHHLARLHPQLVEGNFELLGGHLEQLSLGVDGGGAHSRGLGRHGLAPTARRGELGGAGVSVFDLDELRSYAQLLGHHHRHDGLGSRANVAGSHVQVDAAIGEELDQHGGRRASATGDPQTAGHTYAAPHMAALMRLFCSSP